MNLHIDNLQIDSLDAAPLGKAADPFSPEAMQAGFVSAEPMTRRKTVAVNVGGIVTGGGAPIVVQSMTNTDTADIDGTVAQVAALARAGSELVRITVDRDEAAAAVPHIKEKLLKRGITTPLIGDFHYIGHKLLADHPACAEALSKYRINPGNVGFREKRDIQFGAIIDMAMKNDKPVRIGANWGSLDQRTAHPFDGRERHVSARPRDCPRGYARGDRFNLRCCRPQRAEEIGLGA